MDCLEGYGIPLPRAVLTTSAAEAVAEAQELGFPAVMKLSSPQILHKSDVEGVKVGLTSPR
ncbi:MAG TPA: hypothetical protein ENF32_00355 [Thermosulfidibacter takaii]|uniref:ATP-grasp domain-containing protein n=1 Tax=Thermosulfidibacter takaii TaxID=412593 RepID=A0A7C0Y7H3_9BACT|nr:MAG: hypothetical protein DRI91_00880 [Aquificota bacterium]HDD52509.1 hypothetical protein [Thermosulfidibacter takaii]